MLACFSACNIKKFRWCTTGWLPGKYNITWFSKQWKRLVAPGQQHLLFYAAIGCG
jgi:hypothetical protein